MAVSVNFSIRSDRPGPKAFRFVVADTEGKFAEPSVADYICRYCPDQVWAYATDRISYELPPGEYVWCASSGPSWTTSYGCFTIADDQAVEGKFGLEEVFDPEAIGLVAGDAHLHTWRGRQKDNFEIAFDAEGIDFAGIQYWGLYASHEHVEKPPGRGRFRLGRAWASSDEEVEMHSPWGTWEDTTVVGLSEKLPDLRDGFGYRMNAAFYREARQRGCDMIVYQAPIWAQFPVDAALGLVDSVNLCDNFFSIARPVHGPWEYTYFAADHPCQNKEFGIARWVFQHYYRVLSAGFAMPVSGGSAYPNGGGGGPVGLNRFYVETDYRTEPEDYLANWRGGRTFATNGPFLLAEIDGQRPSSQRLAALPEKSQLLVRVMSGRPILRVEWVADGEVIAEKECDSNASPAKLVWETEMDLTPYQWVAARCFGVSERFLLPLVGKFAPPFLAAHTSPFYLESFGQPSAASRMAAESALNHIGWMRDVVDGKAEAPFADADGPVLGEPEKAEIFATLAEATQVYQAKLDST